MKWEQDLEVTSYPGRILEIIEYEIEQIVFPILHLEAMWPWKSYVTIVGFDFSPVDLGPSKYLCPRVVRLKHTNSLIRSLTPSKDTINVDGGDFDGYYF